MADSKCYGGAMYKLLPFLVLFLAVATNAFCSSWHSCADDLDRLRRRSMDASSAAQNLDSREDALRRCLDSERNYSSTENDCSSERSSYEYALSSYQSSMADVSSAIKKIGHSCKETNHSVSLPNKNKTPISEEYCNMFKSYKGKVPDGVILDVCSESFSVESCSRCIK